jgi:hypothetical protein
MADDLLGGALSNVNFSGAFSGITTAVMYILIGLAVAAFIWLIFWWFSFKIRVRIREIVKGRTVIKEDRARRYKDRDGIYWWKLRRYRVKMPEPPSECIDITAKGKKIIEFFMADDGSFVPIEVKFNYDEWKAQQLSSRDSNAFKPFTTNQRISYVHELRQAETYRKKKLGEILMGIAPMIAIILILAIFMIFFGEVVKPMNGTNAAMVETAKSLTLASDTLSETCLGRVRLQIEKTNGTINGDSPPN